MKRSIVVFAVVAALAASGWWIVSRPAARQPRLVLLYATCTVNRDFLSPYNSRVTYTPALQRFADESVVFEKHHTESGQSGIAFAALFTGTQAMRHGIYYHPTKLPDAALTIAESYRDNGYETFFWAGHPMASPELNYGQGVEEKNTFWKGGKRHAEKRSLLRAEDPRFRSILRRLRDDPDYKAFVLTNFTVTHGAYVDFHLTDFCRAYPEECLDWPAEQFKEVHRLFRQHILGWMYAFDATVANLDLSSAEVQQVAQLAETLYKSNVFNLDRLFGAVLAAIDEHGLRDDSVVAFTADHGEVLYRDDALLKWTHGFALAREELLVPWVLRAPAVPPQRYDSVTRSIDVFPTLAGLSELRLGANEIMGIDLAPVLRGNEPAPSLVALSHTSMLPDSLNSPFWELLYSRFPGRDPNTMWVSGRAGDLVYKLTSEDGTRFEAQVFDWEKDPAERNDLYDPEDEQQAELIRLLARYKTELAEAYGDHDASAARVPSERERELMRSLGYVD